MSDEKNNFQIQHAVSRDATGVLTIDGIRLAYEIHGTGEIPLVILPVSNLTEQGTFYPGGTS